MSLKSRLHKLTARRFRTFEVPGLGTLRVQSLTERERSIVESLIAGDHKLIKSALVQASLVDDDGSRVYGDGPEDLAEIQSLDSSIVDRIAGEAMRLNRVEEADVRALLGELAPTSTTTPS